MSDLVGNPEDRFSQNEAHIAYSLLLRFNVPYDGMHLFQQKQMLHIQLVTILLR